MSKGTASELRPIAEQVLAWTKRRDILNLIAHDDLRRIELCAKATIEAAMFHSLYGPTDA